VVGVASNRVSVPYQIDTVKAEIGREELVVDGEGYTSYVEYDTILATAIYNNGGFTINFPESIDGKYQDKHFLLYAYKSNENVGTFYHGTENKEWGSAFLYSTVEYCHDSIRPAHPAEKMLIVKEHVTKGWNIPYIYHIDSPEVPNLLTSESPYGAKWYIKNYRTPEERYQ
jgi:hypothetical protein